MKFSEARALMPTPSTETIPVMKLAAFAGTSTGDPRVPIKFDDPDAVRAHLLPFPGIRLQALIGPHASVRSHRANAYYWSVVIGLMAKHTGHTDDDLHDAMAEKFLPNEFKRVEFYNRLTGEILLVKTDSRRSSKLSGHVFYDFVEDVRFFALDFLGVETPDPDKEYWRKRRPADRPLTPAMQKRQRLAVSA